MNQVYRLQIGTEAMSYYYDDEDVEALEGLKEMKEIAKKKVGEAGKAIVEKWKEVVGKLLGASKEIKTTGYTSELMIPKEKFSKVQELIKKIKEFFNLSTMGSKIMFAANKTADDMYDIANRIADSRTDIAKLLYVLKDEKQSVKNKVAAGAVLAAGYVKDNYFTFPVSTLLTWFADIIKCVTDFNSLVKRFKDQMAATEMRMNNTSAMTGQDNEDTRAAHKKASKFTVIISYACSVIVAFLSIMRLGKLIKMVGKKAKAAITATKQKADVSTESMTSYYMSDDLCEKYEALESITNTSPYFEATEAFKIDARKIIQQMKEKIKNVKLRIKEFFYKLRDRIRGTQVMKETAYAIPDNIVKMIEGTITEVDNYVKNGNSYKAFESFIADDIALEADSDSEDLIRKLKELQEEIKKNNKLTEEAARKLDPLYDKAIKIMKDIANSQSKVESLVNEAEKNIDNVGQAIDGSESSGKSKAMKYLKKAMLFISICAAFITIIVALNKFKVGKKSVEPAV